MSENIFKKTFKKIKEIVAKRPKSALEWYYFIKDDVVLTPRFQWFSWWMAFLILCAECPQLFGRSIQFSLMSIITYILFTLPCLRFCDTWTKLYQIRRFAKPEEEAKEEEKGKKQKKKKAMTEEEMLEATRKRQKNRKGGEFN
jgi:hypothetical protein